MLWILDADDNDNNKFHTYLLMYLNIFAPSKLSHQRDNL